MEIRFERMNYMNNAELARRIFDCTSDGYDDEEHREEVVTTLYDELEQLEDNSIIKTILLFLCEKIEDYE